jgi:tRNA A-37 threonylcarbamoyl transferase component Bud32
MFKPKVENNSTQIHILLSSLLSSVKKINIVYTVHMQTYRRFRDCVSCLERDYTQVNKRKREFIEI